MSIEFLQFRAGQRKAMTDAMAAVARADAVNLLIGNQLSIPFIPSNTEFLDKQRAYRGGQFAQLDWRP